MSTLDAVTTATPVEQVPVGDPLPLRVAFAGGPALELFGAGVDAVAAGRGDGIEGAAALVVDERPPRGGRRTAERLWRAAQTAGVPVIGVRRTSVAEPAWSGLADLIIGAPLAGDVPALPASAPVDPHLHNPIGFRGAGVAGFAAMVTGSVSAERLQPGIAWLGEITDGEPTSIATPDRRQLPALPPMVLPRKLPRSSRVLGGLRARLGVLDHPAFHASSWDRAGLLTRLCAAGIPVVPAELSSEAAELLGPNLTAAIEATGLEELRDPDGRERASIRVRRAALRHHSPQARWRQIAGALGIDLPSPALVSVVLSTRRQEWLEHGIAQVLRQTYEPRELIVCLHGDEFTEDVEDRVRAQAPDPVKIVRVDDELTLGESLNAGVAVSEGDVVTKMDDDDYYTVDHLWDLVLALEYAEADLVGKGAEFVYVSTVDLTIRRFIGPAETDHSRLGGGVMMARREPLLEIGGWPARNRGEDGWLVKNFKSAGKRVHRTHGFGYILNRHMRGHTWNTYADYFLVQSQREWRGLRFDVTAIEPGADGLEPPTDQD
jgi:Glycosyl transferase family 2